MSEEIKDILEEIRFKAGIYKDHKKRDLSFNDEEKNCALLLDYIEQKENIIKEVREYIVSQKLHKIVDTTGGLTYEERKLLEILDKENEE